MLCMTIVNIVWGLVVQRLMRALGVVKVKVLGQSASQLRPVLVGPQVDIFVFHTAPTVVTWPGGSETRARAAHAPA